MATIRCKPAAANNAGSQESNQTAVPGEVRNGDPNHNSADDPTPGVRRKQVGGVQNRARVNADFWSVSGSCARAERPFPSNWLSGFLVYGIISVGQWWLMSE